MSLKTEKLMQHQEPIDPRQSQAMQHFGKPGNVHANLDDDDEEDQVIGVKVLNNAPDPRMANRNLGKQNLP